MKFSNNNRRIISDLIFFLDHHKYLQVNSKMIGQYDLLLDKFVEIQNRKEQWN